MTSNGGYTTPSSDFTPRILEGDTLEVLRSLPSQSVNCVVTSPPYFGLRRYDICACAVDYRRPKGKGHAYPSTPSGESFARIHAADPNCQSCQGAGTLPGMDRIWGGSAGCAHVWESTAPRRARGADDKGKNAWGHSKGADYDARGGASCALCGAWRGSLGLEPTPRLYVEHLADVIDEVGRVLRNDGTLWLNLGDSRSTHNAGNAPEKRWNRSWMRGHGNVGAEQAGNLVSNAGVPEKNLLGIPWRVAFELQDRGWFLRSEIIWEKPNPNRGSQKDRPTTNHETIFLLTKRPRYWYDVNAVLNPLAKSTLRELRDGYNGTSRKGAYRANGAEDPSEKKRSILKSLEKRGGSTLLTVWRIKVTPYKGAHFATFPVEVPRRCIKLGCPPDGTVLDPFAGTGSTMLAARELGRPSIGIELNPQSVQQARDRCKVEQPVLQAYTTPPVVVQGAEA